jgi:PAT family beta-lactamase induction signal transducer AmpG
MMVGVVATLLAAEPARADAAIDARLRLAPLASLQGLFDAIVGPFVVFFRDHGLIAALMLSAIALYRLPDFVMGPMANPFYQHIGLSKTYVGEIRGTVGLATVFLGIAAGGAFVLRFGQLRALVAGGIMQAAAIAAFATLAHPTPSTLHFGLVMAGDNFSTAFAGVALISYMSSLTTQGYTATQYALLSSAYAWVGKLAKSFSGAAVDALSKGYGLLPAYEIFFISAGLIGIPAIILFIIIGANPSFPQQGRLSHGSG